VLDKLIYLLTDLLLNKCDQGGIMSQETARTPYIRLKVKDQKDGNLLDEEKQKCTCC